MAEEQLAQSSATGTVEASEFSQLLNREFKPKSDKAQEAVSGAVRTLAEQALQSHQEVVVHRTVGQVNLSLLLLVNV